MKMLPDLQVGNRAASLAVTACLLLMPAAAPAAEPVVPDSDPVEKNPPELVKSVMGDHPRLLFGPEDTAALRRFAAGGGKPFFRQMQQYLPVCKAPTRPGFLKDATDGQRVGLWRMPTVALHYVLTDKQESFRRTVGYMKMLLELPHWETTRERDSGMSSANVLIGAALAYDWLHDDLPADFREKFRRKLLGMARAQYYGGHLNRNKATGYWQGDPANNHRWHRDAGMVLATLAAYEGDAEDNWILARCREEMQFVNKWLPPDGTSHEGPSYLIFGGAHLTLANQAADRCFGTEFMKSRFFRNAPLFRLHTVAPGLGKSLHFGDSSGMGSYSNFLYAAAATHELADAQDGLEKLHARNPKAWWLGWMSMLWHDPKLTGGSLEKLDHDAFFPDLGLATMRTGWGKDDVAVTFKCGPLGGYRLNAYRNANGHKYVNVAHDDPDAASFTIFAGGELLAETDRYSKRKKSANHNTLLVNGVGQTVKGRKEGAGWSQPARGGDMTKMAVVTAWKRDGDVVVVEGESAGAYPAIRDVRPALKRFRRILLWVEGKYVLVLDHVLAPEPVELTWLVQGPNLTADKADRSYVLSKGKARCPFVVAGTQKAAVRIAESSADHRGKPLGWQQLQLTWKTDRLRLASVYDPWATGAGVTLETPEGKPATVTVVGDGFRDRWTWSPAGEDFAPTRLVGRRGEKTLVEISATHEPPQP
ncbi:MAG: heparinase II/III family protein [Phycisphaerae bacterium]